MSIMTHNRQMRVRDYREGIVLSPELAEHVENYRLRLSVERCGYSNLTDWHPIIPERWGDFPKAPVQRAIVYAGSANAWAYNHHQTIAKYGEKYVVSWSAGFLHEDYIGQEVHYAWSGDGLNWSQPGTVVATSVGSQLVRNNAGLCEANAKLYCYVGRAGSFGRDMVPPGTFSLEEQSLPLDVYYTEDLKTWDCRESVCDDIYLFEAPRLTLDGSRVCCGFQYRDNRAKVLKWDAGKMLSESPRQVPIPRSPYGLLPEQGTWYQTDDRRIWMYQRDTTMSCRLGVVHSDDDGETWGDLMRTDFPNSYSRAFAGRLTDGRFYIVGNNYNILLDRMHLLIALSDDGYTFDRQYVLVEGQTTRRVNGRHKEDGYHYPNCLSDGSKLLVTYSVNKEDIEVITVDTTKID